MATKYVLKPFRFNFSDLTFMRDQINFRPLYDAKGNAIINWDGIGTVYDAHHVAYVDKGSATANLAAYGSSYVSVTASQGLRDPSGHNNNLYLVNANWGSADQPFLQRTQVVFNQYVKPLAATDPNAFYAKQFATSPDPIAADYTKHGDNLSTPNNEATPTHNVVDYTPRMISQVTTTAEVKFQTESGGTHLVKDANGFTQVADYGLLKTLGQQDAQHSVNQDSTANNEFFIGAQNPGVAPVNGWFVLFGQFFDHGLDFIGKGGDGTKITINLSPQDPLYGVIDPTSGQPATKIVISRADVSGFTADGTPQWVNHTSPYIDQSQTYGSNQEVTDLLRKWVSTDNGATYHAGFNMLDGNTSVAWKNAFGEMTNATLPTLNELRAHLLATGRDDLSWDDVANLRNRDATGHVATGAEAGNSGQALLLDMNPVFDEAHFENSLNPDAAANFVVDIATLQAAARALGAGYDFNYVDGAGANDGYIELKVPDGAMGPGSTAMVLTGASALALWVNFADFSIKTSMQAGPDVITFDPGVRAAVGDLLLAAVGDHYIAGDGRVNENIGLTAVHHVWHEEHNFQVRNIQQAVIAEDLRQERLDQHGTYNHDLLHEWQVATQVVTNKQDANGNYLNNDGSIAWHQDANGNYLNIDGSIAWDEARLFNAAKITVEMEYQHTAVDQFARTITPNIAEFVGYNSGEQADVSLDFSQVAYRFGHSMLRESIDLIDPNGDITGAVMRVALERAFLSPEEFAQKGAAAIALGMTHQQANEIDEFVTPALNQGLLGQPMDLAAINIARGRDLGIPTLNEFRAAIGLREYTSWADFGANMIHPDNLVNFIAAYSFDGNVGLAQAIIDVEQGKDKSAAVLVTELEKVKVTITDKAAFDYALNFLQNTGPSLYGADGFQHIDTWLGGLAEAHITGGLLGETFDTVFTDQISRLMNGDRFYYLYRLDQLQMGEGIINEQFKDIVERNTGVEHLNGNVFAYADKYYDLSENAVANDKTEHKYGDILAKNPDLGVYSTGGNATTGNGDIITVNGVQYIRDLRVADSAATSGTKAINDGLNLDGTPNSGANAHEVIVATDRNDLIYAGDGDDTVYGEGGDDIIYGGNGIDRIYGGDGNDRIYGGDGGDLLDGGAGDDYVSGEQSGVAAAGVDQIIGGEGNDILHSGVGIDKLSGESGDDFIFGESDTDAFTHGGDGNDIIDGGTGGDLLWGDNGDDLIIGGDDQDISAGMNGDDILRPGPFSQAMGGGPDEVLGGDGLTDLGNDGKGVGFDLIDFSDHAWSPQGISIDFATQQNPVVAIDQTTPFPAWVGIEGVIASQSNDSILGDANANWLIGGSGDDQLTGGGGDDLIIGDGIRLDSLIGTYAGGYGNYIDGASHRADGFIQNNGLLDVVDFDKHFTEMLKSATFKDLELGGSQVTRLWRNGVAGSDLADSVTVGDGGTVGEADTAVFTGNRADYTVDTIVFKTANQGEITALRITDNVADRDGTDVVVGVEKFKFADKTMDISNMFNRAPTGSVKVSGFATAPSTSNSQVPSQYRLTVSTAGLQDADGLPASNGFSYQWQALVGAAWVNITQQANAATFAPTSSQLGQQLRVLVSYTDGNGTPEQVASAPTEAVGLLVNGTNKGDTLPGTGNQDILLGLDGNDTLIGGAGSDLLDGGNGNDIMRGGVGNDTYVVNASGDSVVENPNEGNDTVQASISWTLGNNVENLTLTGTNNIDGTGNALDNTITGNSGNNRLSGGGGADTIDAGAGNDTLLATLNDGNDSYDGGAGTDTYDLSATSAGATVDLLAGTASSTQTGSDTLRGIENVIGSSGADSLTGDDNANTLTGGGGDDVLRGGGGADKIDAGAGNDTLLATLNDGNDSYVGGVGTDTYDLSATSAGATVNLLAGTASSTQTGSDTLSGIENVIGSSGADSLTGDNNANTLTGGGGNDVLRGGGGADVLWGGGGADTFVFSALSDFGTTASSHDVINDFEQGTDKIDLSLIDAKTTGAGSSGDQAFSFLGEWNGNGSEFSNQGGELKYHYVTVNGSEHTYVEGTVKNSSVDFQIDLVGHVTLTASDFVL